MAIAWSFGCIEADWPFKPFSDSTVKEIQANLRTISNDLKKLVYKWYDLFSTPGPTFPGLKEVHNTDKVPDLLATRAPTVIFRVKPHNESGHKHEVGRSLNVLNETEACIGILSLEDPSVEENLAWLEGLAEIECIGISLERRHNMDCVALCPFSKRPNRGQSANVLESPVVDPTFRDESGNVLSTDHFHYGSDEMVLAPVANVLAIRRQGIYAYRVTIGLILLTQWVKAKRQFEDILLR